MRADTVEELAKRHSRELYAYLCRFTGNIGLAEDLLGDVFVRLIENKDKMKDGNFQWRPWLYRVATNLAISSMRKQKVRRLFSIGKGREPNEDPITPLALIEQKQAGGRLKDRIEKLGPKHRTVLIMRAYQDMAYEDIADALKINVGTVKSRISEAKEKLKMLMEEE